MSAIALKPHSINLNREYSSPLLRRTPHSLQNVTVVDHGTVGQSSSVESLTSLSSLPNYINESVHRKFDYKTFQAPSRHDRAAAERKPGAGGRVARWASSFEGLLEDPVGVKYFKAFLCKEFAEENILFWEACEELRRISPDDEDELKQEIRHIYRRFLAPDAIMPVNIDSRGKQLAEEALTLPPHPEMFSNQQQQVYTLIRLDSYSRFLKSSLYDKCVACEIEDRPLPLDAPVQSNLERRVSLDGLPMYNRGETQGCDERGTLPRKSKSSRGSKKGLKDIFKNRTKSAYHRDRKSMLETVGRTSSPDLPGLEHHLSHPSLALRTSSLPTSSLPSYVPEFPDPNRVCNVRLWDNSTTLLYVKKSGSTTLSQALENLCERRGVRLSGIDVYLREGDHEDGPRTHLSLDQSVSTLAAQSIVLERRTVFRLDMLPVKRSVGVKARPSKSIAEVLKPVLNKYGLHLHDLIVKTSEECVQLKLDLPVSTLDGTRISVEKKTNSYKREQAEKEKRNIADRRNSRNKFPNKRDTEELIEMVSALQSTKMDDQRGLLCASDLELPDFLKVKPLDVDSNSNANNSNVISAYPTGAFDELELEELSSSVMGVSGTFSSAKYALIRRKGGDVSHRHNLRVNNKRFITESGSQNLFNSLPRLTPSPSLISGKNSAKHPKLLMRCHHSDFNLTLPANPVPLRRFVERKNKLPRYPDNSTLSPIEPKARNEK